MGQVKLNVKLLDMTQNALTLIYAACRQCYSAKFAGDIFEEVKEDQKKQEEFVKSNPQLALWKNMKEQLTGAGGASYFDSGVKGSQVPTLRGKVVKLEPELRPKTVILSIEDGTTADATLKFEMPLAGKVDAGTELSFEGVPESYTASPFMIVFNVEKENLHGWTGKNAPPAHEPAAKK